MPAILTTAYHKINSMTKKIKVVQGGQGAGKNVAISQKLYEHAKEKTRLITVMTDTYDNLKDGAILDFKNLYTNIGLDFDNAYNKQDKELKIDGSVIQFRYISDIKKSAGKSKRRDILYINEANKIGWEVASTYISRTHEHVYIDYNPDFEFWAHTEVPKLKDNKGNSISEQIIVTYQDNEMIPDSEKDFILSRKNNKEWFRIYGLGQTGFYSERMILKYDFTDEIPDTAKQIPSGMDFGVSPDPTVLIDLYMDGNKLYADEVFSMNNLLPEKLDGATRLSIVDKMNEINYVKGRVIVADSAGAVSIRDLRIHGYNCHAVKKFTGSVVIGLNKLRGYDLYLTRRSINLKKGIESYFWKVDANGKIIPEPDGHEPDGIAAIRYVIMMKDRLF